MEEFIEKNVDTIVNKVDSLFQDKIKPFIEKTIQDQKDNLVQDFLSQIKTSYSRELNGFENKSEIKTESENPGVCVVKTGYNQAYYLSGNNYDYNGMKANLIGFEDLLKNNNGREMVFYNYNTDRMSDLKKFISNLKTGEYPIYLYYIGKYEYYQIDQIVLFTNFGSYFMTGYNWTKSLTKNYDYEIPCQMLSSIIESSYRGNFPFTLKNINNYEPSNFGMLIYAKALENFREWWLDYPLIGYQAEMLKKENQAIKEDSEKIKEEVQKIKHMYEILELKEQYYKAVELLKQNKTEREELADKKEKQEKELADKREKQEKELADKREKLEEKAKKLRQIEDIDKEFSKLALMKQKLERKKKEFQKEKDEFDALKNDLLEDSE